MQRGVLRGNEVRGAKQLWNHRNAMTEYHVWVAYRTTTAQLNLFHPGRPLDNSCLTLKACSGHKKPLQHIFWDYKLLSLSVSEYVEETKEY
ncbi:hypothetical protein PC119_g22746 [Phytophthora cactorum]|uniref:Uncharacterized protein n=1 Tax=Phytophthora cactorum TaxID=29920 RepID=A0A8T1B6V2_9STRA|nr:hypothetical protein PC117_g22949 [Phytophthora cactorum]KAG2974105.1 hypothetical protein PC119_g22746 [Phytophthora cactorum]KAG4047770.1 hypothetical protein PC123_g16879 [Phytophthora cactorum]